MFYVPPPDIPLQIMVSEVTPCVSVWHEVHAPVMDEKVQGWMEFNTQPGAVQVLTLGGRLFAVIVGDERRAWVCDDPMAAKPKPPQ